MTYGADAHSDASRGDGGPLRVAYVLHRFPYLTETFIAREMYWIRRSGVDVTIFSLMKPKGPASSEEARALQPRAQYSRALTWRVVKAQARFLRRAPAAYFRALAGVVRQTYREPLVMAVALALFPKSVLFAAMMEDRDIQHVHANFVWLEGLTAGVVRELVGTPFTLHPHAFGLFGRNQVNVRNELENASHVIAISRYHRDYITDLCPQLTPSDVSIVHCGVDTRQIRPGQGGSRTGPPRILSVGRPEEKKGHRYLIDACAILRDRGLAFTCDIVLGGDRSNQQLQDRIDRYGLVDTVRLLGARDQEQLLHEYHNSDIFALASVVAAGGDRDGIPVVLMEAMACAIPVVTTPVAGIPELVQQGVSGVLVPERDAQALAEGIERLMTDEQLRARLGEQGRDVVRSGFEAKVGAAQMADVFRRVAATNGPVGKSSRPRQRAEI